VLAGTIVLLDLSNLRGRPSAELARQAAPWTRLGLVIMLATGPVMFFSDLSRYLANPAFRVKMACLLLALLHHFTLHRRAGKGNAALSLALWTSVVLAGRAIADFDL